MTNEKSNKLHESLETKKVRANVKYVDSLLDNPNEPTTQYFIDRLNLVYETHKFEGTISIFKECADHLQSQSERIKELEESILKLTQKNIDGGMCAGINKTIHDQINAYRELVDHIESMYMKAEKDGDMMGGVGWLCYRKIQIFRDKEGK